MIPVRDGFGRRFRAEVQTLVLRQYRSCEILAAAGRLTALLACAVMLAILAVGPAPAVAGTAKEYHLKVGKELRRYLLVMPEGAAGPLPVVIALHGAGQSAESFRAYVGLDAAAKDHGFVAVYPQGEGRVWNDGRPAAMRLKVMLRPGDDEPFLVLLAQKLIADGIADPTRIYLAGISNGGFMVQKMACRQANLFAAYVAIMATAPANYREECQPSRPVPILFIHGTADGVVAYQGFWTPIGATLSAPDSAALYAKLDGCGVPIRRDLPDLDAFDGTSVFETRWPLCRDGVQVALMTVERGGHQSPARVETQPDLATSFLGLRSRDIDAGEEIWRFASAYALAPPAGGAAAAAPGVAGSSPAVPSTVLAAPRPEGQGAPLPVPSPLRAEAARTAAEPHGGGRTPTGAGLW